MSEPFPEHSVVDAAWVAEFSTVKGIDLWPGRNAPVDRVDSGRRHLRVVNNPSTWRPQFAETQALRVLFDGIVHNREEVERRLAIGTGKLTSDADLVLAACSAWGEDAWQRIKGHFAVLLWDRDRDQLLSVRDPLGVQPLFFAEIAGRLILSPCIRTLRSHPDVKSNLNRPALVDYLSRRSVNLDETYFEQIRRVLPGHILRASSDGSTAIRYWDPVPGSGVIDWIPDGEVQEQFDTLLERTVTCGLDDGPAGIFLSGGLDSAAIAMVAADVCSRNGLHAPQLFSFSFPEPYDERIVQRGVATSLGLTQLQLDFDEVVPLGAVLTSGIALSAELPAPLFNIWAPIYLKLSLEAARRGCRVMMTGEGSDEWLGVSPYLAADLLRGGNVRGLYRLWRAYADYYPEVRWASLTDLVTRYGMRPLLERQWPASKLIDALKRSRARHRHLKTAAGSTSWVAPEPWIAPDPALRTEVSTRLLMRSSRDSDGRNESTYVTSLRHQLNAPTPWSRAEETFVLGRQTGMPISDPFWNVDLIEFMIRVHPFARQRNGMPKALIRERLGRRFPGLGFERQQKKLVGNLIQSITRAETKQALGTLGEDWVLDGLGVIDSRQMLRAMDDLTGVKGWRIWDVLNLEAWVRANH
jgi:asparagine synthetase B (glutamine-hydrolysing)